MGMSPSLTILQIIQADQKVFAGVGTPFVIASWFIMPETARSVPHSYLFECMLKIRRTAAELDELFETKVKPWRFHKTKTALQRGLEERSANVVQ